MQGALTATAPIQPLMMSVDEFALLLQVSSRMVWRLVSSGEAPAPVRFGGSCRWRVETVTNWIDAGCPRQQAN